MNLGKKLISKYRKSKGFQDCHFQIKNRKITKHLNFCLSGRKKFLLTQLITCTWPEKLIFAGKHNEKFGEKLSSSGCFFSKQIKNKNDLILKNYMLLSWLVNILICAVSPLVMVTSWYFSAVVTAWSHWIPNYLCYISAVSSWLLEDWQFICFVLFLIITIAKNIKWISQY